jgi:hypothetical protein
VVTQPGKIVLLSNKPPNFGDETLAKERFVWVDFKVNFKEQGRMDRRVKHEYLPAELPGIANRCLAAYRRLLERGYLEQPSTGAALSVRVQEAVTWAMQFMNDCYEKDPNGTILASAFFLRFRRWMEENSRWDLKTSVTNKNLIRFVNKLPEWETLKSVHPTGEARHYPGIKLRREE